MTDQGRRENLTTIIGFSMPRWLASACFVVLYLAAIVGANLAVAWFGKWASVVNAFVFIGLDLVARDGLHEAWQYRGLAWKMAGLLAVGSLLSWLLNRGAGRIAVASFVAFTLAALTDTFVYALGVRRDWTWLQRSNSSNVASAAVDSVIFPTLAFGGWQPAVIVLQFGAKVLGGAAWLALLRVKASTR